MEATRPDRLLDLCLESLALARASGFAASLGRRRILDLEQRRTRGHSSRDSGADALRAGDKGWEVVDGGWGMLGERGAAP